ncbi:MAG: hypothetical protein V1716_02480 [Candidatus Uhrbacteria bacterium]
MSDLEKLQLEQEVKETEPRENPAQSLSLEKIDEGIICSELIRPTVEEETGEYSELIKEKKAGLNTTRENYVKRYAALVLARKNKAYTEELFTLTEALKKSRAEYLEAKKTYAETLVAAKKSELIRLKKSPEEIQSALAEFLRQDIFQELVIAEEKILQEKQAAEYPPKEKGVLRKLYDRWDSLSTVKKVLITSILTTGIALTNSALVHPQVGIETAGFLLFFSKTVVINLGQELTSGLLGLGVEKVLTKKIEKNLKEETEQLEGEISLENLEKLSEKYHALLEKKAQRGQMAFLASAVTMVAAGRAFGFGLNVLSEHSLFKNVAGALTTSLESGPDIVGKTTEFEGVTKRASGLLKKVLNVFKKTHIDDLDNN